VGLQYSAHGVRFSAVCCCPAAQNSTLLVSLAITVTAKETIDTQHTLSPRLQGLGQERAIKED